MKEMRKLPPIGAKVIVWPGMKTVRDEAHRPVKDAAGVIEKKPARVRDHRGELITGPVSILVSMHYHRLIASGHLDWSTKEEHLAASRKDRETQALSEAPLEDSKHADGVAVDTTEPAETQSGKSRANKPVPEKTSDTSAL